MAANRLNTLLGHLLLVACFTVTGLLASEHHGIIKSGGLPVPGATITATQGDKKVVTTSDETGSYSFPELADGVWTITVESLGFAKATKDVGVAPEAPSPMWDLKYQTLEELTAPATAAVATPPAGAAAPAAGAATPTEKTAETKPAEKPATPATTAATATAAGKNSKNSKNAKNTKTNTPAAGANGRPSLNAALAGQGQGGGFQRLSVNQAAGGADAGGVDAGPPMDSGDLAAAGNQSYTINGSVSSGLDMAQPGGDWFGGRGGPGGPGGDMGGMGPGGIPGMGGDPTQAGLNGGADAGAAAGGRGGRGGGGPGGGPGGGGPGGGPGGRGGGAAGMMAGIPNIGGGGRGGRGGAGGRGGPGGRNPASFGNNRRDPRSRYNFAASINGFTNSFLNARNYSITGQEVDKPSSQTLRSTLTAGGPLKIPHVFDTKGKGTFTINYSFSRNRVGQTFTSLVPTEAEREGDFSGVTVNAKGTAVPVTLYNGATPYPNNQIPANMISPVATALLKYYPLPNFIGGTANSPLNFETSSTAVTNGDNVNARLSYTFNAKNQVNGGIQWQRQNTISPSEFAAAIPGWTDTQTANGVNANAAYIYHFTTRLIATTRYTYSKSTQLLSPFFANTTNIEGLLGIQGTDQAPLFYGPPSLSFSGSGLLGLGDSSPRFNHPQTSAVGESVLWVHTAHQFTFGGDFSRRQTNTLSQINPRGSFSFTGAATALNGNNTVNTGTGYDFADFLLATPDNMSINVANSLSGAAAAQLSKANANSIPANLAALQNTPSGGDRYLRTSVYDLYVADQWKLTQRLSLSLSLRWDYQAPTTELYNRLATIDLPGNYQIPQAAYNNAQQLATGLSVVAGQAGPVTGYQYSDSMLNGKKTDFSPRFGFAYKPFAKHSTVFRGGWGLYFIPSIYSNLVGQLDAQTPFATAYNLTNSCGATLQNALSLPAVTALGCVPKNTATTTNAMNPNFRVGYTQNWQMAVQQDLKFNTIATITYFASKGTGLPQSYYPNSYFNDGSLTQTSSVLSPLCNAGYACPVGYIYENSNGNSTDEAVQFQLMRRLRSGLGANVSYLFNKATDDTPSVSQNWLNLEADHARVAGIRNQTLNISLQYSTGVGARGGGLVNGWKGVLFKDWTVMPSMVLASGAPINITDGGTTLGGTTASNILRASYDGQPAYINGILNKAAFLAPVGTYGNLGRDTLNGPKQFTTSLSANRTFRMADRKNLTFSVQMQNPLNHPVVSSWYTSLQSTQFALPSNYFGMRQISATMRFNF